MRTARALSQPRQPTYRATSATETPGGERLSLGEWLVLALACAAGIAGLLLAASGEEGTVFALGFGLFAGAVIYIGLLIKRHFDRLDRDAG